MQKIKMLEELLSPAMPDLGVASSFSAACQLLLDGQPEQAARLSLEKV